jgi:hypothetical protein
VVCPRVIRRASDLRPTDYESVKGMVADLPLWLFGLVRRCFQVPAACHCREAVAAAMWPKCGLARFGASYLLVACERWNHPRRQSVEARQVG